MKVFVSWSGERSQILARSLHEWLPLVLHYVRPWLSEADVSAGDRWAQEIAKELESSNFGIICVTPENVASPWILFEAGALAKSMQGARVIPLLFNLEFSDVTGPLAQFQAKKITKGGMGEVVQSINHATDQAIPDDRAKQLFNALWPELEKKFNSIPDKMPAEKHVRPPHEILEELVTGVRGLDSRFRDLEGTLNESPARSRRKGMRRTHPGMLEEMAHLASLMTEESNDPIVLLMFGSLVRDDLPWFYELIKDAYREIKDGDPKTGQKAMTRLRRAARMLRRGPFMELMMEDSKEAHVLAMEFPMVLDRVLQRIDVKRLPEDGSTLSTAVLEEDKESGELE